MVSLRPPLARGASGRRHLAGLIALALLAAGGLVAVARGAVDTAAVDVFLERWLTAQKQLATWTADCRQTRSLKTLTVPLVSTGKVWFAAPDRFRWELGQPAQTIAVRRGDEMWVVYPRLKRAEHYALGPNQGGPWREALALLEAGFPRDRAQLDRQFHVADFGATNGLVELGLQPTSGIARRFVSRVTVSVATNAWTLQATELAFADGSRMRNEFNGLVLNPTIDEGQFRPPLGPDYVVTEPLKP